MTENNPKDPKKNKNFMRFKSCVEIFLGFQAKNILNVVKKSNGSLSKSINILKKNKIGYQSIPRSVMLEKRYEKKNLGELATELV